LRAPTTNPTTFRRSASDREEIREAHRRVEETGPLAVPSEAHGDRELAQGRARDGSRARERARRPYAGGGRRVDRRPARSAVGFRPALDAGSSALEQPVALPQVLRQGRGALEFHAGLFESAEFLEQVSARTRTRSPRSLGCRRCQVLFNLISPRDSGNGRPHVSFVGIASSAFALFLRARGRLNDNFYTPIVGPPFRGSVVCDGVRGTQSLSRNSVRGDAMRDKVGPYGFRSVL
jgi:hypothetical protein